MSVFVRGGKFVVDYWPQGKKGKHVRKTLPASVTSIDEAKAIERELRLASRSPEITAPVTSTVDDLFQEYLDWYELHRAERTFRDISGCWKNHLSRHLGHYAASDISVHHINVYKRLRKGEYNGNYKSRKVPVGNRSVNKELAYFSGFLKWCRKNIKGFPKRDLQIDGLPYERPVPGVLSLQEAVRFIQAAEPLYRCLFLLLFNVGVRRSEARFLKWDDVDLDNRTLVVTKKGGKPHLLPISDWLHDELASLRRTSRSRWVFQSPRTGKPDQPVQDLRRAIERARKKAGITKRIYPHLLRHSLATYLMGQNINLRTIQNMLGHSQLSTTQFYTHVAIANLRTALSQAGIDAKPDPCVYEKCRTDEGIQE